MSNLLIYLATPYSAIGKLSKETKLHIQEARFQEALRITAGLMAKGHHVYSPIVHCHPMAIKYDLPKDWAYWKNHLEVVMPHMDEVWVAMMPGWETSTGVTAEIELAKKLGKPVRYVEAVSLCVWAVVNSVLAE